MLMGNKQLQSLIGFTWAVTRLQRRSLVRTLRFVSACTRTRTVAIPGRFPLATSRADVFGGSTLPHLIREVGVGWLPSPFASWTCLHLWWAPPPRSIVIPKLNTSGLARHLLVLEMALISRHGIKELKIWQRRHAEAGHL